MGSSMPDEMFHRSPRAPRHRERLFPDLGHGIGLRTKHYSEILAALAEPASASTSLDHVDFFEIISENYFGPGGNPRRVLRAVRERRPIVMHGVGLSLGSTDPLDVEYLDRLAALASELDPPIVSDHLCWSGVGGHVAHDLLPLPFTEGALVHVAERIARVQDRLGRRILVENVSSYASFTASSLTEWEFLAALVERADCGILLDVNNVYVSAHNHGFDAGVFIAALPSRRIGQIHLAGHSRRGELLIDTHDAEVRSEVWALYRQALALHGPTATLIEWDDRIPPLDRVVAESRRARDTAASTEEARRA